MSTGQIAPSAPTEDSSTTQPKSRKKSTASTKSKSYAQVVNSINPKIQESEPEFAESIDPKRIVYVHGLTEQTKDSNSLHLHMQSLAKFLQESNLWEKFIRINPRDNEKLCRITFFNTATAEKCVAFGKTKIIDTEVRFSYQKQETTTVIVYGLPPSAWPSHLKKEWSNWNPVFIKMKNAYGFTWDEAIIKFACKKDDLPPILTIHNVKCPYRVLKDRQLTINKNLPNSNGNESRPVPTNPVPNHQVIENENNEMETNTTEESNQGIVKQVPTTNTQKDSIVRPKTSINQLPNTTKKVSNTSTTESNTTSTNTRVIPNKERVANISNQTPKKNDNSTSEKRSSSMRSPIDESTQKVNNSSPVYKKPTTTPSTTPVTSQTQFSKRAVKMVNHHKYELTSVSNSSVSNEELNDEVSIDLQFPSKNIPSKNDGSANTQLYKDMVTGSPSGSHNQ